MKSNIQTIVDFIAGQMDSEPVPPSGSAGLTALENAVRSIQKHQSSQELQTLANHVVGAVIDRVRSNIAAQQTLQQFLQGGDHA